METPPTDGLAHDDAVTSRSRHVRIAVWGILTAGLLGFIAFGSVSAISYTYYAFSGRLVRLSPRQSLIDIWRDAVAALPAFTIDWLPSAVMVGSLLIVVLCTIGGAWLLLVQAPDTHRRSTRAE